MTATQSPGSPLGRLVLFIACLAIAGSILAGVLYFTVDLPAQQAAVQPPENKFVAPWWDVNCFTACDNLYLAHTINKATWDACYHTCCGGGLTC